MIGNLRGKSSFAIRTEAGKDRLSGIFSCHVHKPHLLYASGPGESSAHPLGFRQRRSLFFPIRQRLPLSLHSAEHPLAVRPVPRQLSGVSHSPPTQIARAFPETTCKSLTNKTADPWPSNFSPQAAFRIQLRKDAETGRKMGVRVEQSAALSSAISKPEGLPPAAMNPRRRLIPGATLLNTSRPPLSGCWPVQKAIRFYIIPLKKSKEEKPPVAKPGFEVCWTRLLVRTLHRNPKENRNCQRCSGCCRPWTPQIRLVPELRPPFVPGRKSVGQHLLDGRGPEAYGCDCWQTGIHV